LSIWLNDEWSLSKSDIAVSFAQKKEPWFAELDQKIVAWSDYD